MNIVKRVHIAPLGHEYDRIVEPIKRQQADIVYLLEHNREKPKAEYHDELRTELESVVDTVRTQSCDLSDVYAVLGTVTTIAAEHDDDNVYVNVSGGGTIPAIGATIACMDVATEATAYHVEPKSYAHDGSREPASHGVVDTSSLPTYPVDSPSRDQVAILGFLADPWDYFDDARTAPPKKKDLIKYAKEEALSFMADRTKSVGEDKGAFQVLDNNILVPLEEDGYVTVRSDGRRRVIELTERGHNAYRAFKHKLDDQNGDEG